MHTAEALGWICDTLALLCLEQGLRDKKKHAKVWMKWAFWFVLVNGTIQALVTLRLV
jgi:hypothetical protein